MNGQDALGWVCQNQGWIGPALAVIFPASLASAFVDKMPPGVGHFINLLGLNWGDLARSATNALIDAIAHRIPPAPPAPPVPPVPPPQDNPHA